MQGDGQVMVCRQAARRKGEPRCAAPPSLRPPRRTPVRVPQPLRARPCQPSALPLTPLPTRPGGGRRPGRGRSGPSARDQAGRGARRRSVRAPARPRSATHRPRPRPDPRHPTSPLSGARIVPGRRMGGGRSGFRHQRSGGRRCADRGLTGLSPVPPADRPPGPSLRESPWPRVPCCPPHSSARLARCSASSLHRRPGSGPPWSGTPARKVSSRDGTHR